MHMSREWFAVRVKPHKELIARAHFERQGFTVYLPKTLKTRRHARRVEEVVRPFFPGYLFLHLAPEERRWPTISGTIGAIGPVRFGDHYPPVPGWLIESLQAREDEQGYISTKELELSFLKPGNKVKIVCGDLEGFEGVFREIRGQDRAVILIDMLRRQVATTVPVAALTAA